MDSKEVSWAWVTADRLLSHGPCELLYVLFVPSTNATAFADIYDGENTSGDKIVGLRTAQSKCVEVKPIPLYCRRGLYVDTIANTLGLLVQWRELGKRGEA